MSSPQVIWDADKAPAIRWDEPDAVSAVHEPTSLFGKVEQWASDLSGDLKYGSGNTAPGRLLQKMGAPGLYSGVSRGQGDFMGSPVLGPTRMLQGSAELPQSGKHWQGTKDIVGGAMDTMTIPGGFIAPEAGEQTASALGSAGRAIGDAAPNLAAKGKAIGKVAGRWGISKIPVLGELAGRPSLMDLVRAARAKAPGAEQEIDALSEAASGTDVDALSEAAATSSPARPLIRGLLPAAPTELPASSLAEAEGPMLRPAAKMIQRDANTGRMRASFLTRAAEPGEGANYLTPKNATPSLLEEMYEKAQAADEVSGRGGLPPDEFEARFRTDPIFRQSKYVPVRLRLSDQVQQLSQPISDQAKAAWEIAVRSRKPIQPGIDPLLQNVTGEDLMPILEESLKQAMMRGKQ